MSETYGTTGMTNDDDSRELGAVEVSPDYGSGAPSSMAAEVDAPEDGSTKETAKEEARATAEQVKEGARHLAEVGRDEAKDVVQETSQQAKELWEQTRSQLLDQSAQQQTRVAEGLRSLSEELSGMARGSEQQGVASDLAQQAAQRMGDVAGWLDDRDPGSLVSEMKQFARQRPGAFLATAAVIGLVGGRLSRGLAADHADQSGSGTAPGSTGAVGAGAGAGSAPTADHSTAGFSAYGSATGAVRPSADHPVSGAADSLSTPAGMQGGVGAVGGNGMGESTR